MPSSVLLARLPTGVLAPGAELELAHGLQQEGASVAPNVVMPDRSTPIVVVSANATHVRVRNDGDAAESAVFLCERLYSTLAEAATWGQLLWNGRGGGGAPSGPAGGVLGYPGATYPNPSGLASTETIFGGTAAAIRVKGDEGVLATLFTPQDQATAGADAYSFGMFSGLGGPASASADGGEGGALILKAGEGGVSSATRPSGPGGRLELTGGGAGDNGAGGGGNVGGDVEIKGGFAIGDANGGNVYIDGGEFSGTGAPGFVAIGTRDYDQVVYLGRGSGLVQTSGRRASPFTASLFGPGTGGNTIDVYGLGSTRAFSTMGGAGSIDFTATPTLETDAFLEDGTELLIVNTDAAESFTFHGESDLPGSGLLLGAATRVLAPGGYLRLLYRNTTQKWYEIGFLASAS